MTNKHFTGIVFAALLIFTVLLFFQNCGGFAPMFSSGQLVSAASASVPNLTSVPRPFVTLSWQASALGGQQNYSVEQSTDGVNFQVVQQVAPSSTGTTIGGLTNGATYYFRIQALNQSGSSAYTTIVKAVVPDAP